MPKSARVLRVVVASPSDLTTERQAVDRVASELNRGAARDRDLRVEIAKWETDAYPAFHVDGPQGICDQVLKIEDCDILVGIFWTRFGTPTRTGMTGTEHEISKAIKIWRKKHSPQVMIFFNSEAPKLKSAADRRQGMLIAEYRERFPDEGLFWEYDGGSSFETVFRTCLQNYLQNEFPIQRPSGDGEFRPRRNQLPNRTGLRLSIDPRVPPKVVPGILSALSDFTRAYGAFGIDVTISRKGRGGKEKTDA